MQATIRLDGGQGRDRGVIVVREAPVVSGPLFFTLQRFPDGKYLSAESLWRSARDAFRSDDYRQKGGTLSIPIGPDILYELDSDTSYRMSINDSASFTLVVERKIFTALQGKAALEEYQKLHQESGDRGENDAREASVRQTHHGPGWRALLIPILALVLCIGLALRQFSRDQIFPLQDKAISLTSTPRDGQESTSLRTTRSVSASTMENVARILPQTSYFTFENDSSSLEGATPPSQDIQGFLSGKAGTVESFSHTVSEYLQSSFVSSDLNVLLAKRVRVEGAPQEETDTAFELLQDAANDGNTEAMYMLAQYYDPLSPLPHGSVEQDPCLAREWYMRASEGGLAKASLACDELKNYIARKAAEGDRKAQNILSYW